MLLVCPSVCLPGPVRPFVCTFVPYGLAAGKQTNQNWAKQG